MKKIILIILCIFLLVAPMISAEELLTFDNIKIYDKETQIVTIVNTFGLGRNISTIQLNTPLNYEVGTGYGKVAEFTIDLFDDTYTDAFDKLEFYDLNNDEEKFERDFDYKYKTTELVEVNDYKQICKLSLNGTNICEDVVSGTHLEEREVWKDLDTSVLLKGEITIGIFTEVQVRDYVEWIPTLFGKEIDEWASWSANLEVDLILYYTLNETAGTNVRDIAGEDNDGNSTNITFISGLIGGAYSFGGVNSMIFFNKTIGHETYNWTYNLWIHANTTVGEQRVFVPRNDSLTLLRIGVGAPCITTNYCISLGGVHKETTGVVQTMGWEMITFNHNGTGLRFGKNGTYISYFEGVPSAPDNTNTIGTGVGGAVPFKGYIDEFSVYNRSLTDAELVQLYNGGSGITYITTGIITLNSPTNNSEFINTTVEFNCSAFDINTITNVSLIIDSNYNQTNTSGLNADYIFTSLVGLGDHNWTCETCNDLSVCINATENYFSIERIVIFNETHNNITLEGSTETFSIIFDILDPIQVSTVSLVYNGTSYSASTSTFGDYFESEIEITIPDFTSNVNTSFYWSFVLSDGSITNSSTYNQTVNVLAIDDCSVHTNLIFNYTVYDEEDQDTLVNTTIEIEINVFDLTRVNRILNFSQEYSLTNPAEVCLNIPLLTTTNYSLDSTVKYTANETDGNYAIEYYNMLNFTLANSTVPRQTSLYDLIFDKSTDFQLTFKDEYLAFAPNILVNVYRQYIAENTFKIVEIPKTDSNGQTVLHLVRNDVVYNFIMINSEGNVVAVFNNIIAFCQDFTIGDCKINLNARLSEDIIYDPSADIGISYTLSYSNSTDLISLSFVIDDLSAKTVILEVLRNRGFGNRTVCEESLTSASGVITCDVSSISDTDRFLFVNIYVDSSLKVSETIDLESDTSGFGVDGFFIAFLLFILLITIFMHDKQMLVLALGIGWVIVVALGLIRGSLFGSVSAGIWLIVCIIIFLWKLKKEGTG